MPGHAVPRVRHCDQHALRGYRPGPAFGAFGPVPARDLLFPHSAPDLPPVGGMGRGLGTGRGGHAGSDPGHPHWAAGHAGRAAAGRRRQLGRYATNHLLRFEFFVNLVIDIFPRSCIMHIINDRGAANKSKPSTAGRHRGGTKGAAAEGSVFCLKHRSWGRGEHPLDCHYGGELSLTDAKRRFVCESATILPPGIDGWVFYVPAVHKKRPRAGDPAREMRIADTAGRK